MQIFWSGAAKKNLPRAVFLRFGYHDNFSLTGPETYTAALEFSNENDDDKNIIINELPHVLPLIMQGKTSPKNMLLFACNIDPDGGWPYGVRESSLLTMKNPQPHIFELDVFACVKNGGFVSKKEKERLKMVFYQKNGLPLTLADMLSQTTLTPPSPPLGHKGP